MKCAIFDLDGTLVDLFELHLQGFQKVIKENYNLDFHKNDLMSHYGRSGEEIMDAFFQRLGFEKQSYIEIADERRNWVIDNLSEVAVLDGVEKLVDELRDLNFSLALGTSNTKDIGEAIINACGLKNKFEIFSFRDVGIKGKPAPDIFLNAAKLLNAKTPECIVFEDSIYGVSAAKNARMKVVATATGKHSKNELKMLEPDMLVDNLTQVSGGDIDNLLDSI